MNAETLALFIVLFGRIQWYVIKLKWYVIKLKI
jgi:hypothetical protein